jgi:hypothetical protein
MRLLESRFTARQEPTSHYPIAAGWGCSDLAPCCSVAGCCDSDSTCRSAIDIAARGRRSRYRHFREREELAARATANPC